MHVLLIHGGSGRIRPEHQPAYRAGLARALDAGGTLLEAGGSATDAVCAAVRSMEDDPEAFNAGTGSVLTRDGTIECDAALMTSDGAAGAVACVRTSRNPIDLARKVLETTPHVFLVGRGAEALETDPIDPNELVTERSRAALERWRERNDGSPDSTATCGAVGLDEHGRLASATSTGGVLGQWPGRVGDSPIIGAGTWADSTVAISTTGRGEAFLRVAAAHRLASSLGRGVRPAAAFDDLLATVGRADGEGGAIALMRDGTIAFGWNTQHMAWGYRRSGDGPDRTGWDVGQDATVRVI